MKIVGIWLELPVWQQLLALSGFYATTVVAIHLLAFHSPASGWTRSFKGVVAPFFVSVALIFGLLLGFVAGEVWHRNTDAVQVVRGEGDALFALSHLSPDSDPGAAKLPNLILAYAQSVVGEEWRQMREGKRAAATETAFTSLLSAIVAAPVSGSSGAAVQRARFDAVLKLHTLRETRLAIAGDRTDEIKWTTLLILGLISQIAIAAVHALQKLDISLLRDMLLALQSALLYWTEQGEAAKAKLSYRADDCPTCNTASDNAYAHVSHLLDRL